MLRTRGLSKKQRALARSALRYMKDLNQTWTIRKVGRKYEAERKWPDGQTLVAGPLLFIETNFVRLIEVVMNSIDKRRVWEEPRRKLRLS